MKNFVVYKSSAGSGKTTTLAIEYLKLSLANPANFKHILALTFTKDAANEMKQRIIDYLIQIKAYRSGSQLDFIFNPIISAQEELKNREESEGRAKSIALVQAQAQVLLKLILHSYSDFAISTIDSFTHRIIKSFAHDLGIAISFEVELDSDNLLKTAVNELISRIGEDNPKLTEVLLDFSLHKIGSDKSRKIDEDLKGLAKNLLEDVKEEYLVDLRKLSIDELLQIKDQVFAEVKSFNTFVNKEAKIAADLIKAQGLNCKSFYYGSGNICNWFQRLAKVNFDSKEIKPKARVLKSIEEDAWTAGKAEAGDISKIESIKDKLIIQFHLLNDFITEHLDNYLIFTQISQQIYPLVVLNEIEKLVFQLKEESNVLHISDFNKLIAQAISGEPAPFIYERIGNWYHNFLLDEFQDTSALQWNNLLPLIENSLSENHFSLLVGDGKQSIYRWRGSDVKQFVHLPDLLNKPDELSQQREQLLQANYKEEHLLVNYRSDEEIVKFNNDLFGFISNSNWLSETNKKVYNEVDQTVAQNKLAAGRVDIQLIEDSEDAVVQVAILEAIAKVKAEGFAYSDITLLVRKNAIATAYADLLVAEDIPVISSVGLRVSSSSKVKFLLSFFQSVLQPDEMLFKIELLRYLLQSNSFGNYTLDQFHALTSSLIADKRGFIHAFESLLNTNGFSIDEQKLNQADVYEMAEYLIRTFNLTAPDPYLQFFLDILHDFKKSPYSQLSEFMKWWEEHEKEQFIELPSGLNAVTIQTVFKAKGLQYPVVIFPFTDKSLKTMAGRDKSWLNPGLENLSGLKSFPFSISSLKETPLSEAYTEDQSSQKLDNINLLYVALTRAKNRLVILSDKLEEKKGKKGNDDYANFKPSLLMAEYLADKEDYLIEENLYRFGDVLRFPDAEPIADSSFYYLDKMRGSTWRNHLDLSNTSASADKEETYSQQLWGIYVHEVMAKVQNEADVEKALNRAAYLGLIKVEDKTIIGNYIQQIMEHPQLKAFYQRGVKLSNEGDIIDAFGFFHRPDRVVFFEDRTVIIDYKTGKKSDKHKQQIREYAELFAFMDYPKPEAYLIYLHDKLEVIEL